jgi:hypothetical protein
MLAMKANRGVKVPHHSLLTSALDAIITFTSQPIYQQGKIPPQLLIRKLGWSQT